MTCFFIIKVSESYYFYSFLLLHVVAVSRQKQFVSTGYVQPRMMTKLRVSSSVPAGYKLQPFIPRLACNSCHFSTNFDEILQGLFLSHAATILKFS